MTASITSATAPTKVALITGVTGPDGSCLAEFLLATGYEVHGVKRRASSFNTSRVDHIYQDPQTMAAAGFEYFAVGRGG